MSVGRYVFNLFKMSNRAANTLLGGSPEVPLSARAGYWAYMGYRRGKWFSAVINFLFRDKSHCANAYKKEDDSLTKYTSDPEGRFFFPLLVFWLALMVAGVVYLPGMLCSG